jgi:hypothetical protein
VHAATAKADSLRFITLTLRTRQASLGEMLDDLYAGLRAFRRTKAWKQHVRGGVACVEVTRNPRTGGWHPHLHILADGEYWDQRQLSAAWAEITGDSPVVDIRAVRSRRKAAQYVAKYAAKPPEIGDWPAAAIAEYARAMHRRRAVITFGTMHNVPVDRDDEPEKKSVTDARVPLCQVEARSRIGCRRAAVLLAALAQQSAAYARSVQVREGAGRPVLAAAENAGPEAARAAARWLAAHWREHAFTFGTLLEPPTPPPPEELPPGRMIDPLDTPPIDPAWMEQRTQHAD